MSDDSISRRVWNFDKTLSSGTKSAGRLDIPMHKLTENSKKSPVIHDNVVVDNVVNCKTDIPPSNSNAKIIGQHLHRETSDELKKVINFILSLNSFV